MDSLLTLVIPVMTALSRYVPSLYLDKKPINNRRRVAILYSRDGMPIRKELYLEMNTGFILRIRRLMTNRLSWMPSHLKTW